MTFSFGMAKMTAVPPATSFESEDAPLFSVNKDETDEKKNALTLPRLNIGPKAEPAKAKAAYKPAFVFASRKGEVDKKEKVEWELLESPWRKVAFSAEEALVDSVSSYKPSCASVSEARVLLLGPVGAGKSSFISSVHSAFSGRVTNRAMVGTSSTSFTQKVEQQSNAGHLRSYTIRRRGESGDQPVALTLCDTMGLGTADMTGPSLHDVLSVIKGHAPEGHKFSPDQPLRTETLGYVKKPLASERIHCVAFVLDATKIDSYGKGMGGTFQQLREHISNLSVHQVALLTHVDQLCPETACDITKVYRSRLVQNTMKKAAALLGMSMSYLVPVKNYSCELDVEGDTDALLLSAVQHLLQYVELHFQDLADLRLV
ncbi:interferon-induced protein 44-like isoform X2 [Conger conger]|uniref:interferon-induced protein 44-like isoform X2 n=1 Tax=Conger conger TaxID=82655 RepID=UPI002A5AA536|nr:interferon-induced protein 44-like isoform X2 [Conger conger]